MGKNDCRQKCLNKSLITKNENHKSHLPPGVPTLQKWLARVATINIINNWFWKSWNEQSFWVKSAVFHKLILSSVWYCMLSQQPTYTHFAKEFDTYNFKIFTSICHSCLSFDVFLYGIKNIGRQKFIPTKQLSIFSPWGLY